MFLVTRLVLTNRSVLFQNRVFALGTLKFVFDIGYFLQINDVALLTICWNFNLTYANESVRAVHVNITWIIILFKGPLKHESQILLQWS